MNIALPVAAVESRPPQIEDPSNRRLLHPLADALLPLALRLGVAPTTVSLAGLVCGIAAAVCYWHWEEPLAVLAGFALMLGWHVLDGLDGKLARATGRSSDFGRVLDGACDYLVFATVEMAIVFSHRPDWPPVLALCLAAAAAHVVQAATYEGERAAWLRRASGRFQAPARPRTGNWLTVGHNWIEARLGNGDRQVDVMLARQPRRLDRYLAATAPRLRALSVLGANSRTLTIALACLAGAPALYWWWTLIGLTALGQALRWRLRRAEAGFA